MKIINIITGLVACALASASNTASSDESIQEGTIHYRETEVIDKMYITEFDKVKSAGELVNVVKRLLDERKDEVQHGDPAEYAKEKNPKRKAYLKNYYAEEAGEMIRDYARLAAHRIASSKRNPKKRFQIVMKKVDQHVGTFMEKIKEIYEEQLEKVKMAPKKSPKRVSIPDPVPTKINEPKEPEVILPGNESEEWRNENNTDNSEDEEFSVIDITPI